MLTASAIAIPRKIDCVAAMEAPPGSFSPMRRATMAVVDRLMPSAMENTSISMDSVRPTVAMAFAPRRATQNTSTKANSDSISISSTMGMASRTTARPIESWVKS